MSVVLHHGKLEDVLPTLAPESIESCVTDTPYHLTDIGRSFQGKGGTIDPRSGNERSEQRQTGFMGMKWDGGDVAFRVETWLHVFRVLKPGGYLLAFGGTRTHHRMVCAIEDAGFEIRDEFDWVFFTGFPKSSNQEGEWDGWGTATKPYKEPICVARKPLIGTVAENLAIHRTGALNIDGCRVGDFTNTTPSGMARLNARNHELGYRPSAYGRDGEASAESRYTEQGVTNFSPKPGPRGGDPMGRWPAGLIHDGSAEVLAAFPDSDGQNGDLNGQSEHRLSRGIYGDWPAPRAAPARVETETSASRFFFCAKASTADREDGVSDFQPIKCNDGRDTPIDNAYQRGESLRKNTHPTVKPTELMRWLCRLVTPPGGTVLDCFMGSGSTGRGAVLEGFNFVGVEMTDEYLPIARARIAAAEKQRDAELEDKRIAGLQGELAL